MKKHILKADKKAKTITDHTEYTEGDLKKAEATELQYSEQEERGSYADTMSNDKVKMPDQEIADPTAHRNYLFNMRIRFKGLLDISSSDYNEKYYYRFKSNAETWYT